MKLSWKSPVLALIVLFTSLGLGSQGYITKMKIETEQFNLQVQNNQREADKARTLLQGLQERLKGPPSEISLEDAVPETILGIYASTQGTSLQISGIKSAAFSGGRSPSEGAVLIDQLDVRLVDLYVRLRWSDFKELKLFAERTSKLPIYLKEAKIEGEAATFVFNIIGK